MWSSAKCVKRELKPLKNCRNRNNQEDSGQPHRIRVAQILHQSAVESGGGGTDKALRKQRREAGENASPNRDRQKYGSPNEEAQRCCLPIPEKHDSLRAPKEIRQDLEKAGANLEGRGVCVFHLNWYVCVAQREKPSRGSLVA